MSKKNPFIEFLKDTTPLKDNNRAQPDSSLKAQESRPKRTVKPKSINSSKPLHLSDPHDEFPENDSILSYCRSGTRRSDWLNLKKGKIIIQKELDLHGFTVNEARKKIEHFLLQAQQQNLFHLRVIHGKGNHGNGRSIIKNHVNHWLPQVEFVLAFYSCLPKYGGTGAIYILLKKSNTQPNQQAF